MEDPESKKYLLEGHLPPCSGVSLHNVQLMLGTKSCSHLPLHSVDKLTPALGRNDIHITCAPGPPHVEALEVYGGRKRHIRQNAQQREEAEWRAHGTKPRDHGCPQKGIARKILKRLGAQSVTLAVVDNQIMFLSSIAFPRHQLSCRPFPYPCLTTNKMILLPNPIKTQVVLNVWFISFVEMRQTQCHYRVLPSCYLLNTWRTLYHITGSVFHGLVFPSISFSILE